MTEDRDLELWRRWLELARDRARLEGERGCLELQVEKAELQVEKAEGRIALETGASGQVSWRTGASAVGIAAEAHLGLEGEIRAGRSTSEGAWACRGVIRRLLPSLPAEMADVLRPLVDHEGNSAIDLSRAYAIVAPAEPAVQFNVKHPE